jgi:hypothetical protein
VENKFENPESSSEHVACEVPVGHAGGGAEPLQEVQDRAVGITIVSGVGVKP